MSSVEVYAYPRSRVGKYNVADVVLRCQELVDEHHVARENRDRVRRILNGGRDGAVALMGRAPSRGDLPAANLMLSGINRLGQLIGHAPEVKVDDTSPSESERSLKAADKRERIVAHYDNESKLKLQLPQAARWMLGYGYVPFIVKERMSRNGFVYPHLEMRDSFDSYPSRWGAGQQPRDIVFLRRMSIKDLIETYPHAAHLLLPRQHVSGIGMGTVVEGPWGTPSQTSAFQSAGRWENDTNTGVEVAEYWCDDGMYMVATDKQVLLDYVPNLCSQPQFYVAKRFAFDALTGQFDHILGLMAAMAKLQVLAIIAMEESAFAEVNVYGNIDGTYRKGHNAVNYFEPGTRVERPTTNLPYQYFTEIDRMERYARQMAGYPPDADGESPNSFVTGRGLETLRSGTTQEAREYQLIVGYAMEWADQVRLELDEATNGDRSLPLVGYHKGSAFSESYVPTRHIKGNHATRRVYGTLAGWDEATKVVTGLQLLQAGVISVVTMQENIQGLENVQRERERIRNEKIEAAAMAGLQEAVNQGDPRAFMIATDLLREGELKDVFTKWLTPDDPQPSPEEMAMAGMLQPPPGPQAPAVPPAISTVLSQLRGSGEAVGGVQTVGRLPPRPA